MSEDGFHHVGGFLTEDERKVLLDTFRATIEVAPLVQPRMPQGNPFSVEVTSLGKYGWWSDSKGYRYVEAHPRTQNPWPEIPETVLRVYERACWYCGIRPARVDVCLINHYPDGEAKLGMHRDEQERCDAPIVSFSLGADAMFVLGGPEKTGYPRRRFILQDGDLVILSGLSRNFYHGIERVMPTMFNALPEGGRINYTLRQVDP